MRFALTTALLLALMGADNPRTTTKVIRNGKTTTYITDVHQNGKVERYKTRAVEQNKGKTIKTWNYAYGQAKQPKK